jgi:4-amino-4-deoxy-L-arabinose transferase-like glycosyltransferase
MMPNLDSQTKTHSFLARFYAYRAVLLVIVVISSVALGLRLMTYDRYLPFVDYTDEGVYVALAQDIRGIADHSVITDIYGAIPPLYSYFNAGVQEFYDAIKPHNWNLISEYYSVLRLVAVGMGILTALIMAWAGWQIAGFWAALLAGLVWAAAPIIVEFNSLAIPDPIVYLFTALAFAAALHAWRKQAPLWLLVALLSAIIVIYTKYWIVTTTLPFLVATAVLFWQAPRKMLPWVILFGIIATVTAAYLIIVINPIGNLEVKESYFQPTNTIDINRNFNNLWHAVYPMGVPAYVLGMVGGVIAYFYSQKHNWRRIELKYIGLLLLFIVPGIPLTSAISNVGLSEAGRIRHILPTSTMLIVLWGIAITQIMWTLQAWSKQQKTPVLRWLPAFPLVVVGILLLPRYITENHDLIQKYNLTHITNQVRDWSDSAIPAEGLVMQPYNSDLDRTWNRTWGAYAGNNPLNYWSETAEDIIAASPEAYAQRNILYYVINEKDLTAGDYTLPDIRDFQDKLFLLKTFPAKPSETVGFTSYFYRMLPPQYATDFTYGEQIKLVGYDLSASEIAPGETLVLRPYWGLEQTPQANYSMFVHLYPANETTILAQLDGALVNHDRQTSQWVDLDEIYIGRDTALVIPAELTPGDYRLAIGVYDYTTFARLKNGDQDFFEIPILVAVSD